MNWTLFARLSPPVAQALHDDICRQSVSQSTLEFLPLLLSGMDEPVYVSYNGGSIAENGAFFQLPSFLVVQPMIEYSRNKLSLPLNIIHVDFNHCCLPSEARCTCVS